MNIEKLVNELRIALNNEDHTPQEWHDITHQLAGLSRMAQMRISPPPEAERVDETK